MKTEDNTKNSYQNFDFHFQILENTFLNSFDFQILENTFLNTFEILFHLHLEYNFSVVIVHTKISISR